MEKTNISKETVVIAYMDIATTKSGKACIISLVRSIEDIFDLPKTGKPNFIIQVSQAQLDLLKRRVLKLKTSAGVLDSEFAFKVGNCRSTAVIQLERHAPNSKYVNAKGEEITRPDHETYSFSVDTIIIPDHFLATMESVADKNLTSNWKTVAFNIPKNIFEEQETADPIADPISATVPQ